MGEACSANEGVRNALKVLVGKLDGKRPHRKPRRRWEDNIKINVKEIRFEDVDWNHLDQDRDQWRALVNTVMNLQVP
jgi:hypothetical protein